MQILVTDFHAEADQTLMVAHRHQAESVPEPDEAPQRFRAGMRLKYVAQGQRACIGFRTLLPEGGFTKHACPQSRLITKGTQCYPCSRADESWQIHNTSREQASPALTSYLDRPHFLYLAAFADGRLKVGTSRSERRLSRWVEQGAVMTVRLGEYPDGWEVREAENLVSQRTDATQAVRTNTKAKAFTQPLGQPELAQTLADSVDDTLNLLDAYGLRGEGVNPELGAEGAPLPESLAELSGVDPWVNSVAAPYLGQVFQPYAPQLTTGSHDFELVDLVGSTAFLRVGELEPPTLDFAEENMSDLRVANLAALKAHVLEISEDSEASKDSGADA